MCFHEQEIAGDGRVAPGADLKRHVGKLREFDFIAVLDEPRSALLIGILIRASQGQELCEVRSETREILGQIFRGICAVVRFLELQISCTIAFCYDASCANRLHAPANRRRIRCFTGLLIFRASKNFPNTHS